MEILIQTCLMPLATKTQNDSFRFVHELKQEMHADLMYVKSLEKEIDELESDKAEFSNMYDGKGKSVETKFDKPYVVRQPNSQRIPKPSVLGKPVPFSNSLERMYFPKTKSVPKDNVSEGLSKPVTAQTLPQIAGKATVRNTNPRVSTSAGVIHKPNVSRPQLKSNQSRDKVLPNNSQVKLKKTKVEVHHRIPSVSNKVKSVTACKDSLNSRTLNANVVCATCNKCLVDSNHFACVTKMLNDVHARTKKPKVVPIRTRKPKSQANKAIATPHKKKVASKSTKQKPQRDYRKLYETPSNLKLLCNFVEKFMGTVPFGNDLFAPILGYGDLVQGNVMINRVYYVEVLNHNLFSVGQFCDADLDVAFMKSTCFVRDLQDQLCSSCELSKAKISSFKSKVVPSSKGRLNLLHMGLCGPMRVASINRKKYILVIVDDYSRYTWTLFLRSKDETPEVCFGQGHMGMLRERCGSDLVQMRPQSQSLSVGQFCDADLEVAFRKSTCFVRDLQGNDLLIGNRGSDLYTISLQESTSSTPLCLMAKATPTQAWLWHRRLYHLNFDYINLLSKKDIVIGSNPQDKQPSTNIQPTSAPSTPTYVHAEENNNDQAEEGEHSPDDEFTNPLCALTQDVAESSSHNIGNSNVLTFNQPQVFEYRWMKDHPLEQVHRNPSRPMQTRRQLATDLEMYMYALTVSTAEPKNIKEAMADFAWIEAMQEELHQFDRLQ
nr:integrase, catalytic region, zinc finger, CCHC-type, peptidase aspartic, catalytic [Tanacetum cinerariifolium]